VPSAQQPERHLDCVHRVDRRVDRDLVIRDLLTRPPAKGLERILVQEPLRRVLHPDVDGHRGSFSLVAGRVRHVLQVVRCVEAWRFSQCQTHPVKTALLRPAISWPIRRAAR
jgi:hypothetical protein